MSGILVQVNVSSGGMPKLPLSQAKVTFDGLEGDWQKNRKYHGGRDRAVCLYSQELYQWLREIHNIDLLPGSVGENFTTTGIDLQSLTKGDRLQVGNCVIELTDIRVPCKNLNQWDPKLLKVIQGHSGWMAKVITEGDVFPGDTITREP
jgi:MOSC domain-containing protein YiiM